MPQWILDPLTAITKDFSIVDFIPCAWCSSSLTLLKKADKSSPMADCGPMGTLVTTGLDGIAIGITAFKACGVCGFIFPPLFSIFFGYFTYQYARMMIRKKYGIESQSEVIHYFLAPTYGLAQLRAQVGGMKGHEPQANNENVALMSARDAEQEVDVYSELQLTMSVSSTFGTAKNFSYGYALGWPSGFPEQWFQEYRVFDKRSMASQMMQAMK